jgi:hypothetical protein
VLAMAGCGSSGGAGTSGGGRTSGGSSASASSPSPQVAQLVALIKRNGVNQYFGGGGINTNARMVITGATCKATGGQKYTCEMTYDFTAPNGTRRKLEMGGIPGTCASACSLNWLKATQQAHIIANLGMDPHSHVALCAAAIKKAIGASYSGGPPAPQNPAVQRDCKGVRHGVYNGP